MAASSQQLDEGLVGANEANFFEGTLPGLQEEEDEKEQDLGCLYNQNNELCLLSYFTAQHARQNPIQKVIAWLDNTTDDPVEDATLGEHGLDRDESLVDLANLPPSPTGGSAPNQDTSAEDMIQSAINLLADEDTSSSDDSMVQYGTQPEAAADQSTRAEAEHELQEVYGTPTAIRGNFIPVSSPSPSTRHQVLQPVVYAASNLNKADLVNTSAMMDKQSANKMPSSTRSRSRSPVKQGTAKDHARRSRSLSPVKSSSRAQHRVSFVDSYDEPYNTNVGDKAISSQLKPVQEYPGAPSLIAARRHLASPAPIDTYAANQQARAVSIRRAGAPIIVEHRTSRILLEDEVLREHPVGKFQPTFTGDDSSSTYSYGPGGLPTAFSARIDPLFAKGPGPRLQGTANRENETGNPLFSSYQDWMRGRDLRNSGFGLPTSSGKDKESQQQLATVEKKPEKVGYRGEPYTPLDLVFPDVAARKPSKTMIGARGWLEDTTASLEKKPATPKKVGFFDNLKNKAKAMIDMSGDKAARLSSGNPDGSRKNGKKRELLISLDPREQSLLYCELEFIIHQALSNYITVQFNSGRLSTQKLDRISDEWKRKGRPKVVGFRYDLDTQLELVRLHMSEFKFYSREATPAVLLGIIDMMRVNARAIKVRTYCQPDTVIAKQLLDSQNLFNILGCSEDEHVQLASITNFYRNVLDREKSFHAQEAQAVTSPSTATVTARYGGSTPSGLMSSSDREYHSTPTRRRSIIDRSRLGSPYPWPDMLADRSPLADR